MKKRIVCEDEYEAQKLAGLIYVKQDKDTFITGILEVIENEVVISVKDKSAHSILLKDKFEVESFADFIQSVVEKKHRITGTTILNDVVEIIKE
jgi:predicted CopG family antitoxin